MIERQNHNLDVVGLIPTIATSISWKLHSFLTNGSVAQWLEQDS